MLLVIQGDETNYLMFETEFVSLDGESLYFKQGGEVIQGPPHGRYQIFQYGACIQSGSYPLKSKPEDGSFEELEITTRLRNALRYYFVGRPDKDMLVSSIANMNIQELVKVPNLGIGSLAELHIALTNAGWPPVWKRKKRLREKTSAFYCKPDARFEV